MVPISYPSLLLLLATSNQTSIDVLDLDLGLLEHQFTNHLGREPPLALRAHRVNEGLVRLLASNPENVVDEGVFLIVNTGDRGKSCLEFVTLRLVIEGRVAALVCGDSRHGEQLCCNGLPVLVRAADVSLLIRTSVLEQIVKHIGLSPWFSIVLAMKKTHADQTLVVDAFTILVL